jgi:hypothetical protein
MPQLLILDSLCLLLIGLDLYLSGKRMRKYGINVELNPLVRYVARTEGITAAVAILLVSNVMLLGMFQPSPTLLSMFTGAKLALAALQIRSLQIEHSNASQPKLSE